MKKTSPLLIGGIIIGVIALVVLVTLLARNGMSKRAAPIEPVESITLKGNGISLQIDGSGNAVWQTSEGTRTELWGRDKTSSLFEYYYANWAQNAEVTNGSATVNVGNDELGNAVLAEDGVGGGGGGNGGGDVSQYFPTPTPTPAGSGGSGGGSGGGGNGGGPSWCTHWKLSYCADPPTPAPTTTPTPTPGSSATPLPPDCNDPGNQQTGRTVIGNELCLPTATQTP